MSLAGVSVLGKFSVSPFHFLILTFIQLASVGSWLRLVMQGPRDLLEGKSRKYGVDDGCGICNVFFLLE